MWFDEGFKPQTVENFVVLCIGLRESGEGKFADEFMRYLLHLSCPLAPEPKPTSAPAPEPEQEQVPPLPRRRVTARPYPWLGPTEHST